MSQIAVVLGVVLVGTLYWLFAVPGVTDARIPTGPAAIERGEYLVAAGGCVSCHAGSEQSDSLSGGMVLESPFGKFRVPNITPDVSTGIGGWEGADFLRAVKHGRSPGGGFYYPAFPYPAYAGMTDEDVLDMAAYLMSLPPVEFEAGPHELPWWLQRWTIAGWNRLAEIMSPAFPDELDPQVARGAYLARHLGHCGECHTPRNALGIPELGREFGGGTLADGEVEAIDAAALAEWSADDFVLLLTLGLKPDGEFVGGAMESVIEHNTSRLTTGDQKALAAFFTRHAAE